MTHALVALLLAMALPGKGTMTGTVKDRDTSRPVSGVTVVAQGPQGELAEVTDDRGNYTITEVPAGKYLVVFYVPGATAPKLRKEALVAPDVTVRVDAAFSTREEDSKKTEKVLEVVERAPSVDVGSTKRGTKFDKEYMSKVPPRGRDFESLIENTPGVSGDHSVSLGGAQSVENNYVIDGLSVGSSGTASAPPPPPRPSTGDLRVAAATPAAAAPPTAPNEPPKPVPRATDPQRAARRDRLLVYTGDVSLAVYDVRATLTKIEALAGKLGGYLARRDDTTVVVRVPARQFDEAMAAIPGLGDVVHLHVTVDDVKDDFFDLELRLKNARAVRERLEKLLAKAVSVEDTLRVDAQLRRITEEIEGLEGKLKSLGERLAYATLHVTCSQRAVESLGKEPFELPFAWLSDLGIAHLEAVR